MHTICCIKLNICFLTMLSKNATIKSGQMKVNLIWHIIRVPGHFYFDKNAYSFNVRTLCVQLTFVWRQSELCVFCVQLRLCAFFIVRR